MGRREQREWREGGAETDSNPFLKDFFNFIYIYTAKVVVAVVVGFTEDRMMDIITGRAPPPARAG